MDTADSVTEPPPSLTRILVAERRLVRLGIRKALESEPEQAFKICAEAADADGAIRLAKLSRPDICLIGWNMPGGGIHAVEAICQMDASQRVVVITGTERIEDLLACLRAGAMGYVPDTTDANGLRKALRAVLRGEPLIPRSLVRHLVVELRSLTHAGTGTTVRETQVLEALRRGETTAMIADQLGISPITVRRHISELVRKLGVSGRNALAQSGTDIQPGGEGRRST